jgi:hypothetical protein
MLFGLDYVHGPPIPALKAANVSFVCRYLSYPNSLTQAKILTAQEAETLSSAGIEIVSNYEWYAARCLESAASGIQDAQIAASQHQAAGGPPDRPIYFSVDADVQGSQVVNYFNGIHQVLPLSRIGAYGSYHVMQYLLDHHLITWAWQTYAWSGGAWEPRRNIEQYQNGMVIGGASVDYDHALTADYGQWRTHMAIDINTPGVSQFFDEVDGNHWHCKQTGRVIQFAILDAYKSAGNTPQKGLEDWGLPVSPEIPLDAKGNVRQHFERKVVFYDPQHIHDNPPGAGAVYGAHLYSGQGQDPNLAKLSADLANEKVEVAKLEAELAAVPKTTGIDPVKFMQFQEKLLLEADVLKAAIGMPGVPLV